MATITENFHPALVLVVDDDDTVRLLAGASLESEGFRVIEARDGEEAIARFNSEKPDIVLLDVLMTGMDGFDACQAIRKIPGGEHIPILMMTGLDDVESINRAYDVGATDFTPKPINYALLSHRARYMLRAKATADQLRQSQARLSNAQRIARLAHWEWDADSNLVLWSDEIFEICGREPGQIPENIEGFLEIVHPEDRDQVSFALHALVENDRPCNLEHRVLRADGGERIVHQEGQCVPSDSGLGKCIIGTMQDITQRKDAEQRIYHLSHFDALTGLPNRGFLKEHLSYAIASANRSDHQLALLSVGLDNFHRVNDMLGRESGDRLLTAFVKRLLESLRGSDCVARFHDPSRFTNGEYSGTVARLGGDEFVIVLSNIHRSEDAGVVAKRIADCMNEPFIESDTEVIITVSIGIILYPENGDDTDTLLQNASSAMHAAKDSRDNTYRYFSQAINEQARARFQIEADLRTAISEQQFVLHYQPKVLAADGTPCGMEALIRWEHPERGLVPPDKFIGISEDSGLIVPMGEWALAEACSQTKAWRDIGISSCKVAVNISASQFRDDNLIASIRQSLEHTALEPEHLEVEITEGTLMADMDGSREVLMQLKSMGIGVALDDFGTGYSSMSYLKKFPIDRLKIDRSFVRDLPADEESAAIVRAIIGMCRGLRKSVIAEGVETRDVWEYLRDLGCDEIQGFYFSRPLAANKYADWVQEHSTPNQQLTASATG